MWNICLQLYSVLFHRTFQSSLRTTWKPGWPTSTACWLWIINFYKQMWDFCSFFTHANTFSTLLCYKECFLMFVSYDHSCVGWGGSRSPGAAEVSDLRQRRSLRSEVRWRIPAVSAALRHCYLEPFSFYWPGSQIRPGESAYSWLFLCSFFELHFPCTNNTPCLCCSL